MRCGVDEHDIYSWNNFAQIFHFTSPIILPRKNKTRWCMKNENLFRNRFIFLALSPPTKQKASLFEPKPFLLRYCKDEVGKKNIPNSIFILDFTTVNLGERILDARENWLSIENTMRCSNEAKERRKK